MSLLNNFYHGNVADYELKVADTIASHSRDNLKELSKCMNYHVICDTKDRAYVVEKLTLHASDIGSDIETLMGSIEDFNCYLMTCFADVDFLSLGDYTIEEMEALSTMKEYIQMGIEIQETRLHKPYIVLK